MRGQYRWEFTQGSPTASGMNLVWIHQSRCGSTPPVHPHPPVHEALEALRPPLHVRRGANRLRSDVGGHWAVQLRASMGGEHIVKVDCKRRCGSTQWTASHLSTDVLEALLAQRVLLKLRPAGLKILLGLGEPMGGGGQGLGEPMPKGRGRGGLGQGPDEMVGVESPPPCSAIQLLPKDRLRCHPSQLLLKVQLHSRLTVRPTCSDWCPR